MANSSTFHSIYPCHGSACYPVYLGPVREALNGSCSSLAPYARWRRECRVANVGIGNVVVELVTSPVHPVSAERSPPSARVAQSGPPPTISGSSPYEIVSGFPPSDIRSTLFADPINFPCGGGDTQLCGSWPSNVQSLPTMLLHLRGSRSATPESGLYFAT